MSGLKKRSLNASTDRVEDDKQVTEKTLSRRGVNGSMSRAGDSAPGIPTADIITSADREGPPPKDKYVGLPRTESMEILAPMQQTEPESQWIMLDIIVQCFLVQHHINPIHMFILCKMRRYLRVLFVCTLLIFCSLLYVFNQLVSSLESANHQERAQRTRAADPGLSERAQYDRCNSGSVTRWKPYWRISDAVCPNNCVTDSALRSASRVSGGPEPERLEPVGLAVVACGSRLEETLTMLKSAVLFSRRHLHFHIFAEDDLHAGFRQTLESWPQRFRSKFDYSIYPITFPSENAREWKKLFKPCASQRLFLPLILKQVDSVLYVDTDILFLRPAEDVWSFLSRFNGSHVAAMAPEHEEPRIGWYNRFARHPYYGKTGVNSGVMLMNMTRIRHKHFKNDMTAVDLKWADLLMPLLHKYKLNITWGDQDLLNIIFHHNPECLLVLECQWNYRPDHCIYGSNCISAEQHGVYVLHGNRGVYHDDKQPAFRAVYDAIQQFPFDEDPVRGLLLPLEEKLRSTDHTYCGRSRHAFTKRLRQTVRDLQEDHHSSRRTEV
ncbi:glucoside xylosyltransferase 1-like isoform X1 [Labeo rohita]|uniref:Glucoside xylosyltransferase 1 n=1 Tax=Labeo rohita TaxID=84645 RepID=A0A498MJA1_LABRO|nr:glucoside xylosyltransferase 1-like isoform X1 [Labeo rohita]